MFHYLVYQTTNLVNGKIYVGMHKTKYPNDGYLGSGTVLLRAIAKHGREAFLKEVLFTFDNPEEMVAKERELVTKEFCDREDTYNLNVGGKGGWYHTNKIYTVEARKEWSKIANNAQRVRGATDPSFLEYRVLQAKNLQALTRERVRSTGMWCTFSGRKHTPETKEMMNSGKKISYLGEGNPVFGRIWITKDGSNPRMIQSKELSELELQGWVRGRKKR